MSFYWKTPDGWLFLNDKTLNIMSINIIDPINKQNLYVQKINSNTNIIPFIDQCVETTTQKRLRIGINDIMKEYKKWCNEQGYSQDYTRKLFREELYKLDFKEDKSKGVDLNGKTWKKEGII